MPPCHQRATFAQPIKAIYRAEDADMALSGLRSSRPNGASATGVSDPQSEAGHIITESNVVRLARRQFERRAVASHEFHLRSPPVGFGRPVPVHLCLMAISARFQAE